MSQKRLPYPPTRRDDVVDVYHGTAVPDPYRWLEAADSAETRAWVAAQNEVTRAFLEQLPARDALRQRLTELWDYPRYSVPLRKGSGYFFSKNDGLQNQPVLYRQPSPGGEATLVLDPNELSPDGTVAVTNYTFSRDGRFLAYALSSGGSDRQIIKIRDVETGRDYEESLHDCRFAVVAWKEDNSGFFYNRYPPAGGDPEAAYRNNRLFWHQLGTPQAQDRLIYERPDAPDLTFSPKITEDGRYLVLHVSHAAIAKNRLYYRPLEEDGPFIRLIDQADAYYLLVGNDGPVFYVHTNLEAPGGRLVAIDLERPEREQWQTLIPEQEETLDRVLMVNDQFVALVLRQAHHQVRLYGRDGSAAGELELPGMGSVLDISGRRQDSELFLSFESYLHPGATFRYDFAGARLDALQRPAVEFDPASYETRQFFYPSRDGTQVSLFVTCKKGIALDGRNPTLLYGYGGFNISLTPAFTVPQLVWLENGGVFAVANLRGGGEYGEVWHEGGMLAQKQNVFDDFIAAAEWLIAGGYTRPEKLAIMGRSNGGLLVAACMLQRPELFGAVVCGVPVTDMLRYHRFTAGRFWVAEYGDAENNAEHFRFLYAYSPLHNVREGVAYPPILITTAESDDRVVPLHARKFTAALQQAGSPAPVLLRTDSKAGHGLGKPTAKLIEEWSDIYAFLLSTLGAA